MTDSRLLLLGTLAAGLLPVGLLVAADIAFGPAGGSDGVFWLVLLLGPALVALAFYPRLQGRALRVAIGGLLVEMLVGLAFAAALSGANWS